jgi:hypothetical protein
MAVTNADLLAAIKLIAAKLDKLQAEETAAKEAMAALLNQLADKIPTVGE